MKIYPSFFALALFLLPSAALASGGGISQDYANILETRIQSLEEQVRQLTNQVEQAQYQAKTAQDRLARLEEDMNTRFRMIEGSGATPGAGLSGQGEGPVPLTPEGTARVNPDENRLGQLTTGQAPVMPDDPNVAYDQAFQNIRGGDYEAAEVALRAFLQKWPRNELSSNAAYWLGETFYVRGDYSAAAKSFAEGYQTYPKGAKAEDTLLKLGLTLSALNRKQDACVTFSQLEGEFPQMSATSRRRMEQERSKLECSAAGSTHGATGTSSRRNRNR